MNDSGSPLDWEEAPTEAANLVILLLPDGNRQAVGSTTEVIPIDLAGPLPTGGRVLPAADPEFATCYHAEMPTLIGFLVKCGNGFGQ